MANRDNVEFNLSEKIRNLESKFEEKYILVVPTEDVKEFIKRLKEKTKLHKEIENIIDKLAGEKLR